MLIMETVTQSDLKEIKELLTEIKINQIRTEENLSGQIRALGEKVSGIDKRLEVIETRVNSLTGWIVGVLFVLVGGLLGLLGKATLFPNP